MISISSSSGIQLNPQVNINLPKQFSTSISLSKISLSLNFLSGLSFTILSINPTTSFKLPNLTLFAKKDSNNNPADETNALPWAVIEVATFTLYNTDT